MRPRPRARANPVLRGELALDAASQEPADARPVRWAAPQGQKWIDGCPQIPIKKAREKLIAKGLKLHREGTAGFR